jgi:hypothetical protein
MDDPFSQPAALSRSPCAQAVPSSGPTRAFSTSALLILPGALLRPPLAMLRPCLSPIPYKVTPRQGPQEGAHRRAHRHQVLRSALHRRGHFDHLPLRHSPILAHPPPWPTASSRACTLRSSCTTTAWRSRYVRSCTAPVVVPVHQSAPDAHMIAAYCATLPIQEPVVEACTPWLGMHAVAGHAHGG